MLKFSVGIYAPVDTNSAIEASIDKAAIAQKKIKSNSGDGIAFFSEDMRQSMISAADVHLSECLKTFPPTY